jgi:type VI secretion system protein VasD
MMTLPARAGIVLALFLAACAGPAPAPPTLVNATITTTADVNDSAPIALRVYQLVSPVSFDGAPFFPLFDKDTGVLKDDLIKREDLLLAPGQSKTLAITPDNRAQAIGIFAAYRDYEHVTWHATVKIPPHETSTLTVTADKAGVTAKIEPAKPAK